MQAALATSGLIICRTDARMPYRHACLGVWLAAQVYGEDPFLTSRMAVTFDASAPVSESEGIDRTSLRLPGAQEDLVRAVARSGVPVVVVVVHGGPLDVSPLLALEGVGALISAPYGGQQGHKRLTRNTRK
ncbi:putative beta-D-xylosidase 7 [Tetrabaena socialis]|uniref:Putative beta-D-xylosidase 7 n=1 Tax=Tetrabaena socialis TaxID=47790 RepID=A0A2J8AI42_9CHLO|nr:putative beta-D-xylosidase 7 [Tetrabaena socialis]|eukprot:PNH12193.1 putative beta-D-xylosidase 7 [Tetrabaena socialis]